MVLCEQRAPFEGSVLPQISEIPQEVRSGLQQHKNPVIAFAVIKRCSIHSSVGTLTCMQTTVCKFGRNPRRSDFCASTKVPVSRDLWP